LSSGSDGADTYPELETASSIIQIISE
jgi:hypothetical protein